MRLAERDAILGRIKINDPRLSRVRRNHSNVTTAERIIHLILSLNWIHIKHFIIDHQE